MFRFVIIVILFLLSLLTLFKAPTNLLWYVSILITEFSWVFFLIALLIMVIPGLSDKYKVATTIVGLISLILFSIPVISAYRISLNLNQQLNTALGQSGSLQKPPFKLTQIITGINEPQINFKTFTYNADKANPLTLDFYRAGAEGKRPCIVVVHGGSWAGGDSRQLPELNSHLAKAGYNVATINYRLAPKYKFPAPVEDVQTALKYLREHSDELSIDTINFVLLGRSAGGQIVLSAAYTLNDPSIKGVVSFYGPADMVWGYANPSNPLVLNSRKVMENYLGGSYQKIPQQYVNSSATVTVNNQSVPTLLIHGQNDPLVGYQHAEFLSQKLHQYGVKHFVLTLPWATHACDYTLNGPSGQLSTYTVERFLQAITKP